LIEKISDLFQVHFILIVDFDGYLVSGISI
jgi:hypothetical protein